MTETTASIHVRDSATVVSFHWRGFDGDDCFDDFHIDVIEKGITKQFLFGACVVSGLRKLARFFRDSREQSASGGFQSPDKRFYDVIRTAEGFSIAITIEGSGLAARFDLIDPSVYVKDEILRTIYER